MGKFTDLFIIFSVILAGEILITIACGMRCPVQFLAMRFTRDRHPGFDIFLPRIIAKYNIHVFSIIYSIIIFAIVYHVL